MNRKLHIWQEEFGKASFRVQTESEALHREMLQSEDFQLVGWGVNTPLWIHRAEFPSMAKARRLLERYFGKGVAIHTNKSRAI
jgi:hypothetical protein